MPGRKPAVSPKIIKEKILEVDIFDQNKVLKNRDDEVWKNLCALCDNKIKPLNVFKMVEQDRHLILTDYKKEKGIIDQVVNDQSDEVNHDFDVSDNVADDIESHNQALEEKLEVKTNKKKLVFEIVIPADKWPSISPKEKVYKSGSTGDVLQSGWTDKIRALIFQNKKLPCAYSFERHFVGSVDSYIKIEGHCTDPNCKAKINLFCQEKPATDACAEFTVITVDTRHIVHSKTVRLQNPLKDSIGKELIHQMPQQWRRNERRKIMIDGDPEPAHLFKLSQLQNARQDAKNKELGIARGIKLFDSLSELKNNVEFNRFIRIIGYDYFFIIYWSPQQTSVHNDIVDKLNNTVSLDTTASVTLKINRPNGESSDLFLSIMCTNIDKLIVPITQALSERNDTCFYVYWLQNWVLSGGKVPRHLVTDRGKAIRNGACIAFNLLSLKSYRDICLLILFGELVIIKLYTFMRIDIAHLIHSVSKWPCFTNVKSHIKLLYVKSIGYISTINKLEQFEKVLTYVLIIACSKYYDELCQKCMTRILKLLQTYKFDLNTSASLDSDDVIDSHIKNDENPGKVDKKITLTHTYINMIQENVISKVKNDDKEAVGVQTNDYYLPDLAKRIAELSNDFVCWTNVMQKYFENPHDVAVSARSEACFSDIKSTLDSMMRADKFLVHHCRNIDADMLLARAEINKLIINNNIEKPKPINFDSDHLKAVERWRKKFYELNIDDDIFVDAKISTSLSTSSRISNNLETSDTGLKVVQNNSTNHDKIRAAVISAKDHAYAKFAKDIDLQSSRLDDKNLLMNNIKISTIEESVKKPKIRGIHVRPTPDIKLVLQQEHTSKNSARRKNITNGNKQVERQMMRKRIKFTNTCAFDTITEILSNTCFTVMDFKNFLEKNRNVTLIKNYLCYANTVLNYSVAGVSTTIYTNRAHILYSLLKPEGNTVDCNINISQLFLTLMTSYESTVEKVICSKCSFKEEFKRLITFLPNLNIAWIHNYKTLQDELNQHFADQTYKCKNKKCNLMSAIGTYTLGPYLWIDTDEAYRKSTYAQEELKLDTENFVSDITHIPKKIIVKNEIFLLCGIVKYIPPFDEKGIGHYIAYCLSNSKWIERNDLVKYKSILPVNSPSIKLSSIFYAKSSLISSD